MEEMVDAFTKARPEILEFASRPMEPGSPKRKRSAVEPVEENPRRKRTRSSGRTLRSPQPLEITILDSEEDNDGDYEPSMLCLTINVIRLTFCRGRACCLPDMFRSNDRESCPTTHRQLQWYTAK